MKNIFFKINHKGLIHHTRRSLVQKEREYTHTKKVDAGEGVANATCKQCNMSRLKQKGYIGLRVKIEFLYIQLEKFVHNYIKETAVKNTVVRQRHEHLSAPRCSHDMFPCQTFKRVFSKSPNTLMYPFSLEVAHIMSGKKTHRQQTGGMTNVETASQKVHPHNKECVRKRVRELRPDQ